MRELGQLIWIFTRTVGVSHHRLQLQSEVWLHLTQTFPCWPEMSNPDTGNNLVWQHRLQSPPRDQTSPLTGGGLHKLYFYLQPAPQMHPYFYHQQCSCDSLIPGQQTRILLHCVSSMENIQQSRTGEKLSAFPLRHCLPEAADKGPPEDQEGINTSSPLLIHLPIHTGNVNLTVLLNINYVACKIFQ